MVVVTRKSISSMIIQTTLVLVILAETIIFLRFILKILAASEQSLFVKWFYQISFKLIYPFWDSFPLTTYNGKYLVEVSSVFAMFMYAITAFLIIYFAFSLAPGRKSTQRYN